MKFEDVQTYNDKTKALTLITKITDFEKQEVETKTYQYPFFVKGIYTKKAIEFGAELEEAEYAISTDLFDRLASFFVELYGKQFKKDEFINGINQGVIVDTLVVMLFGVLQGDTKND